MALIKSIKGKNPSFGKEVYLADNTTVIGDVEIGNYCSLWFSSVVRGDVNSIKIGNKVNIQDGAIIHCTYKKAKTTIGDNVSIGHNAIVHGCTIESNVLIGMGAIIMDKVIVKKNSIIAAGSVVLEGTEIPEGSTFAGVPARMVKKNIPKDINKLTDNLSENYIMYSSWLRD
tara:strand:+ start:550 stop:1065 length:516 start_codon:yes stop_codon:yes gene_type:complete